MNTVGILINTLPAYSVQIAAHLPSLSAEVHAISAQGQIVITLQHESDEFITECITQIQSLIGVLTAALVYHHSETTEENSA
jgi:nitrate reductase NapD